MTLLEQLNKWMYENSHLSDFAFANELRKKMQQFIQEEKEEPKTYTQEEYDNHGKEMYVKGVENYGLAEVGVKNNPPKTV